MYSHNCSCLPNKNQPAFTGTISQNLDIFRTYKTKSFSNFEENTGTMHLPVNVDINRMTSLSSSRQGDRPNVSTKTSSIMHLVCNFRDSAPKFKIRNSPLNLSSLERTRSNCKTYFAPYDSVSTMPLVSSHLVGGFVGSKSQLGRRPSSHSVGINMWDIIREVIEYFGNSKSMPEKEKCQRASMVDLECMSTDSPKDNNEQYLAINQLRPINKLSSDICNCTMKGENCVNVIKQSYADVAKARLPNIETPVKIVGDERHEQRPCCPQSKHKNNTENSSASTNRDRITSECSADSEDSFIVFECCETDNKSEDDSINSSDDESALDLQLSSAEGSPVVNESASGTHGGLDKFNFGQTKKPGVRKVHFAEGPSIVKVHTMLTWDFAYRAARRGPWEMMARDSERFKCRIGNTEILLKPVLDPQHRTAVYRQRFADLAETK